jgi:hypothetical protein
MLNPVRLLILLAMFGAGLWIVAEGAGLIFISLNTTPATTIVIAEFSLLNAAGISGLRAVQAPKDGWLGWASALCFTLGNVGISIFLIGRVP